MKIIYMATYAFYLFSMVDARFEVHFLRNHSTIWTLYAIATIVGVLCFCIKKIGSHGLKIRKHSIDKYQCLILIVLGIEIFNQYTELEEWLYLSCFLISLFATADIFSRYNALLELMLINFLVPNIGIALNCIANDINVIENVRNINILTFFSSSYSSRTRFWLGFNNPNMIGNLSSTLILLSMPLLIYLKEHKSYRYISVVTVLFVIFDFLIMMESGTRTALLSVVVGGMAYVLFANTSIRNQKKRERIAALVLSGMILGCCVIIVSDKFISTYLNSGRIESYQLISILKGISSIIGIGVISPGGDGLITVKGQTLLLHLDNYYIYIFITLGLIGCVTFIAFFISIFKSIYNKGRYDKFTQAVLSCFAFDMVYGFSETCILYPQFPSSVMLFTFFLCVAKKSVLQEIYEEHNSACIN